METERKLEPANSDDASWICELLETNKKILGGRHVFLRWAQSRKATNEYWLVIRPAAFIHFRIKRNGTVALYEIAVREDHKRQGLGRFLLEYMRGPGRPIELKTDADNEESNAFYSGMGMKMIQQKKSKSGKKLFNIYWG